ncbi:hypothetical protein [Staphylococcus ratti]|uniref:Lipase n=1 Tax=Staphylococcus ratti TaxID=2892440 RepID=A0ABY3PD56_9STAP|nr:hypothetical protein [Staphylococcus ratti]UEX90272.1 hypothetical protein LN051_00950 [Staphylococcus ratti]
MKDKREISPISSYTEKNSAISYKTYEIEAEMLKGAKQSDFEISIEEDKEYREFPPNLKYIDSFVDKSTGMSGSAFLDTNTNRVTIGFAGTNVDNKLDLIKDVGADINIGLGMVDAADPYFVEANKFVEKIKKNHEIEGFTGHSKGGRDAAVLGIEHNVDSIVEFNAATTHVTNTTVANKLNQDLIASMIEGYSPYLTSPIIGLSSYQSMLDTKIGPKNSIHEFIKMTIFDSKAKDFNGEITHFRNNDDPLSLGLMLLGGKYYGEDVVLGSGSHSLSSMLTYEKQLEIKKKLNKYPFDKSLKNKHKEVHDTTQKRLEKIDALRANMVRTNGGGLSSSQEKLIESAIALTLIKGLNDLLDAEIQLLCKEYQSAIEDLGVLWQDTKHKGQEVAHGLLTDDEIIEALREGGATEQSIFNEPKETIKTKEAKLKEVRQKYDDLVTKMENAINEIVNNDQNLAQQLGVMSS